MVCPDLKINYNWVFFIEIHLASITPDGNVDWVSFCRKVSFVTVSVSVKLNIFSGDFSIRYLKFFYL